MATAEETVCAVLEVDRQLLDDIVSEVNQRLTCPCGNSPFKDGPPTEMELRGMLRSLYPEKELSFTGGRDV